MNKADVLARLAANANPDAVAGKARYGIVVTNAYCVSMPFLRALAKEIGHDHALAKALWKTGIPDCRLLAPMIADPAATDDALLEAWVADLDSWDVCDGFCANLVRKLPVASRKAMQWSARQEEFVRRAGFATMATLLVHDKRAPNAAFLPFLARIEEMAGDERNFVKKAVNWALRQVGKRNAALNRAAIAAARRIEAQGTPSARWIARDALKELQDPVQKARIVARSAPRAAARRQKAPA